MIVISNEVKIRAGIEQGCVYNFSPLVGVYNHYYVVLNKNPKSDDEIYLAPFTTKKEKVLKMIELARLDLKTCVEVTKSDCSFLLHKSTVIDCNRVISTTVEDLIGLIEKSEGSCNYPKLSEGLLERVLNGVRVSRMVKPVVKGVV